ncbi:hypothetical protein FACS1894156_7000 [Bacteroidia bacterium]|nr:hypothetical protein FACS1894156_7000 [Bacteroidia bacterium]
MNAALKKDILEIAKANPYGFTVELTTLEKVKNGIVAAYKETQDCFGAEGLEKVLMHAESHGKIVGGWLNFENKRYYFDSCKVFENRDAAIAFGKENEQLAVFDLGELRVIKL